MAYQPINLGTAANDGTGDTLREAGNKINSNFTETNAAVTAAQSTASAAAPATRQLLASGIASGGGDLSSDVTITVTKATGAEVVAATNDTHAVTPKALADAGITPGSGGGVPTTRTLTASGLVTGGGDLSADRTFTVPKASSSEVATGTNDTKAVTPLAMVAISSAVPLSTKMPKISWHGDSIGQLAGYLEPASPLLWSLARQPRSMEMLRNGQDNGSGSNEVGGNFAVSGSISGPLYSGLNRTGSIVNAGTTDNMIDSARLARIAAYAPDIMFIEIGSNESSIAAALDGTILNVKDLIAANPNPRKRVVIFAPFPKANYDKHVMDYTRWAEQMARNTPGYHFVDWRAYSVDENSATGAPLSTMSSDGVHPQAPFGRLAASQVSDLLDRLGIEKISPRGVSQSDVYDATNAPAGNLMGTRGLFLGTGGVVIGGTVTGSLAANMLFSTSNSQLTAAGTKGTFTDRRGQVHQAQIITFGTSGGALAGTYDFQIIIPNIASPPQGKRLYSQLLAQFTNLAGCSAIGYSLVNSNGTDCSVQMGYPLTNLQTSLAIFPTSATPENMDLVNPTVSIVNADNTSPLNLTITARFFSGSTPAGTIAFGAAGVWPEITAP